MVDNLFNTTAPQAAAPNVFDASQNIAANDAKNQYMQAQTSGAMTDQQQKLRSMQASMLGSLAQLPPDQFEKAKQTIIPIANKLNPSVQFDADSIDQPTARMIAMGGVPVQDQPQYGMTQAMAGLFQRLGQPQADQAEQTSPAGMGQPQGGLAGMSAGDQAMLAFAKPDSLNAMTNVQKMQNESPQGKGLATQLEDTNKNIAEAQKGAAAIDSRMGTMDSIINRMIELAPNTASGSLGKKQLEQERNLAQVNNQLNLGFKPSDTLAAQTEFENNNGQLFNRELPAMLQAMGSGKTNLGLQQALKEGSQVDEYKTPEEKIAALKNIQGLLHQTQSDTHSYLGQLTGKPSAAPQQNQSSSQSQPAPEGTIARNQAGQVMVKRGGQWVPQ